MSQSKIIEHLSDLKESRCYKIEALYSELKHILDSYIGSVMNEHIKGEFEHKFTSMLRSYGVGYNIITILDGNTFYMFSESFGGEFFIRDFMKYYELNK